MSESAMDMTGSWGPESGASEEAITDTQQLVGFELPRDLLDFMRQRNGGEGTLGPGDDDKIGWLRLHPIEDWPAVSDAYGFSVRKLLIIGNDGGDWAYCLSLDALPMQYRVVDYGAGGKGRYLGSSFLEFLVAVRDGVLPKPPKLAGPKQKPVKVPGPPKDKPLRELKAGGTVISMALSPDGSQLAVFASGSGNIVFDVASGKALAPPEMGPKTGVVVGWMETRPVTVVGEYDPEYPRLKVSLLDMFTKKVISQWNCLAGSGDRIAISPDGTRMAGFQPHSTQYFVDPHSGRKIKELPKFSNYPPALAWKSDSSMLALGRISYVTPHDHNDARLPPQPDWAVLILSREGEEVGQVKIDTGGTEHEQRLARESPCVCSVDFDARGEHLLVARAKQVRIYHMTGAAPSETPVATLTVPLRSIDAACFVAGDRVAVTTAEGKIVLFDWKTQKPVRTWHTTKLQSRILLATPDGRLLLTADGSLPYDGAHSESKVVRVWRVE